MPQLEDEHVTVSVVEAGTVKNADYHLHLNVSCNDTKGNFCKRHTLIVEKYPV